MQHSTLIEVLEANRTAPRSIHYLEGEREERIVPFGELYERALGILWHLQKLGADRGDKLIVFLNHNEQFIDGFWAALSGGIVPVPLAVGISDEHRHKLLRIARLLGDPFLYTDRKNLDRLGAFAESVGESATFERLKRRALLADSIDNISRAGRAVRATPDDVAFIQFSSGSTSVPKGIVLTHRNLIANCRSTTAAAGFNENDVSLSWMPLTHDMGLIGKHIFMFANRIENHLMPTELFIRRPLLWPKFASERRATILSSPNFGYRHFLKVLGDRSLEGVDLQRRAADLQRRRADLGRALRRVHGPHGAVRPEAHRDVPGLRARRGDARDDLPRAGHRLQRRSLRPPPARDRRAGRPGSARTRATRCR